MSECQCTQSSGCHLDIQHHISVFSTERWPDLPSTFQCSCSEQLGRSITRPLVRKLRPTFPNMQIVRDDLYIKNPEQYNSLWVCCIRMKKTAISAAYFLIDVFLPAQSVGATPPVNQRRWGNISHRHCRVLHVEWKDHVWTWFSTGRRSYEKMTYCSSYC